MSKVQEILDRVGKRVGGAEWFIILLPFLEQLFTALLEQCTNTEEEAVDMITDPRLWQIVYMQREVVRAMRREKKISRRQRNPRAWQVVSAVIEEANADPESIRLAFSETSQ